MVEFLSHSHNNDDIKVFHSSEPGQIKTGKTLLMKFLYCKYAQDITLGSTPDTKI